MSRNSFKTLVAPAVRSFLILITHGEPAMNALRFPRVATFAWACALVAGLAPSAFAEIVYTMTNASGLQDGWALSGTITVSGTGTALGSAAITGWAYTVTKELDSYTYSSNDSDAYANAFGLLATPTQLIVPYAEGSDMNNLQLVVQNGAGVLMWSTESVDFSSQYMANDSPSPGSFWQQQNVAFPLTTTDGWVIGSVSGPPSSVPEIDPNSLGSVLALVLGSLGLLERCRLRHTSNG
jgi:hypothetical protein